MRLQVKFNDRSDKLQFIEDNKDRIVNTHRHWWNSMAIYEDYIILWNGKETEEVHMGTDFFDSYSFKVNKETDAYREYSYSVQSSKKKFRTNKYRQIASQLSHYGSLTSWKLAILLDRFDRRDYDAIFDLLKTKRFRSQFRKSICDQIVKFVKTPKNMRKFPFPLSERQLCSIRPNKRYY